jgi:hypothetical protein
MHVQIKVYVKSCLYTNAAKLSANPQGHPPLMPLLHDKEPIKKVHLTSQDPGPCGYKVTQQQEMFNVDFTSLSYLIPAPTGGACTYSNSKSYALHFMQIGLKIPPTFRSRPHEDKFIEEEFQEFLASYDTTRKRTTVMNHIAQAFVECLHLMLGDQLQVAISLMEWHKDVIRLIQACA